MTSGKDLQVSLNLDTGKVVSLEIAKLDGRRALTDTAIVLLREEVGWKPPISD